ncbi:MAG: hypothetical protein IT539_10765 [Bradyrhizobiaceae bacterium]|nr:hypothetical protein [Bradyrhizobiaceae bacterium]
MPAVKRQPNWEEQAGPSVPRERASADYENPRENVADLPEPVELSARKARAGISLPEMLLVLIFGIVLTIIGYLVGLELLF